MLAETLMQLAQVAGLTVVAAAVTDGWQAGRRKFARLLGRGDPNKEQLAEQRLEETRARLIGLEGADLERARADLAGQWTTRLADLLEEDPGVEAELRALVEEVQRGLPGGGVCGRSFGRRGRGCERRGRSRLVRCGGRSRKCYAAGPYRSGSGDQVAGPGVVRDLGPGSVFADRGSTAIGQVVQQRPGVTGKPVRLAEPLPLLAGREGLLADLDTRLNGGDGPGPRRVVLHGLGGAGKTSVALAYAHRHLAEVGVAWQFAADDPTVLAAGFAELAAQLGARDVIDTRDPVASVHGVLADLAGGWLLIFDNAPDQVSMQAFLPPAGAGQVLITSQNPNWPHGQALEVPLLSTGVAADFLVTRTGDQDQRAARELAGELDGLPLALEQAAAYILATGGSLTDTWACSGSGALRC